MTQMSLVQQILRRVVLCNVTSEHDSSFVFFGSLVLSPQRGKVDFLFFFLSHMAKKQFSCATGAP